MTFDSLGTKSSSVRHPVGYFFYVARDQITSVRCPAAGWSERGPPGLTRGSMGGGRDCLCDVPSVSPNAGG